eukprot:scaffold7572_cov124-Isochrysis_galbana.AAC.4
MRASVAMIITPRQLASARRHAVRLYAWVSAVHLHLIRSDRGMHVDASRLYRSAVTQCDQMEMELPAIPQ